MQVNVDNINEIIKGNKFFFLKIHKIYNIFYFSHELKKKARFSKKLIYKINKSIEVLIPLTKNATKWKNNNTHLLSIANCFAWWKKSSIRVDVNKFSC